MRRDRAVRGLTVGELRRKKPTRYSRRGRAGRATLSAPVWIKAEATA